MANNIKAVIMAGGKGTRLQSIAVDIPKPMVKVLDKPILERQIECLKAFNIKEIIIIVGYLGNVIKDYFQDGSKFGVSITYIEENEPLGTGGALYYLKDSMKDDFVLVFGDLVFDINWDRFIDFHKSHHSTVSLFAHPNNHPFDSDLVVTDKDNKVISFDSKHNVRNYYYKNLVNAGLYIVSPKIFSYFPKLEKKDLEKDVIGIILDKDNIYAYKSSEYVKDAGTPDRYELVQNDLKNGIIAKKNYKNPQKCIFLDRDGVINKFHIGFVVKEDDFVLNSWSAEAIKKINRSEYLAIVVTNQPQIARGEATFETINNIHNKMETLLGKDGAYVDDIFFCPHHTDKGFKGEIPELKIDCNCRKPKIGMLLQAKEKYNIDFSTSYMVGDTTRDVQTGFNAGVKTVLVTDSGALPIESKPFPAQPNYKVSTLLDAVDLILNN